MTEFTHHPSPIALVLAGLLAASVVGASYFWARGRAASPIRVGLAMVRWFVLAVLVICLLDPQWVETFQNPRKARVAVLLDTSKSMATHDLGTGRLEAGRTWIQSHLLSDDGSGLDVVSLGFGATLQRLSSLAGASPTGGVSELTGALETLLGSPGDQPLTGVVLVSDGIETSNRDPESIARLYRRQGIPIHTLLTGTTNEPRDVLIKNVTVKRAVPNESPTRISLSVRSPGFRGSVGFLTIRRGKEVLASKEVRLNGGNQVVEMEFTPRQKGFQVYEVSLASTPGEWLASNNRRQFGLEVIDPTIRVLYMEGTPQNSRSPQPEWKYLKDALESDKYIQVTALYRTLGNNGQFLNTVDSDPETGQRIYPVEHPTKGFPRTLAGLLEYDVVIHSDIRISSFTLDQLNSMAMLVEQHGGGFVMIGGNSAFGKGGYHQTILDRLIPVAMSNGNDSEARPVKLQITRQGLAHPIIRFSGTVEETRRVWWDKFPMLYGMNQVERAKPGAVVLAQEGDISGAAFQDANVLIAVQEVGRGRSMAFTSDTTRAWGRDFETLWGEPIRTGSPLTESNSDSRYYRQFWVNAIRWLAAGKAGKTNQPVVVELSQGYCSPGDTITASVRVRDSSQRDIPTAEVSVFVVHGSKTNRAATAKYDAASRCYLADIVPAVDGSMVVTAVAQQKGMRLGEDRQLLVAESVDRELQDLRAKPERMSSIARLSGGRSWNLQTAKRSDLDVVFQEVPPPTVEYKRQPLWDKPWWLGMVLTLLCSEWAIRRWKGLA